MIGGVTASAAVEVDVDVDVDAQVSFGFAVAGAILPPKLTKFQLTGSTYFVSLCSFLSHTVLHGAAGADFNINSQLHGSFDSGAIPIFQVGLPGLNFPGYAGPLVFFLFESLTRVQHPERWAAIQGQRATDCGSRTRDRCKSSPNHGISVRAQTICRSRQVSSGTSRPCSWFSLPTKEAPRPRRTPCIDVSHCHSWPHAFMTRCSALSLSLASNVTTEGNLTGHLIPRIEVGVSVLSLANANVRKPN